MRFKLFGRFKFSFAPVLLAPVFLLLLSGFPLHASNLEYKVKAAYLYNFARFVEWPETSGEGEFTLCILGQDPFGALLDPLSGQPVHKQALVLRRDLKAAQAQECRIVFIARSERARFKPWLPQLHQAGVLTVSDIKGFAAAGGMVGLVMQADRVTMEINLQSVRQGRLQISAKLLEISTLVE